MHTGPGPQPPWGYDPGQRPPRGSWLLKGVAVLILALVASPFLPESVRVILPEGWRLRLPRVEFVRQRPGQEQRQIAGADAPSAPAPDRNESASIARGALDAIGVEGRKSDVAPKPVHVSPARRSHRAARHVARPPQDPADEQDDVAYMSDQGTSVIPIKFQTEIRLSSALRRDGAEAGGTTRTAPDDAGATRPDPARADGDAELDWPILCGQVVDESGTPVGGARVELESPRLTVSTDAKGCFCVACPAGNRTVRVEAAGRGQATRTVTLHRNLFDMRIALSQRP